MTFESLGLSGPILRALSSVGYENPTPIQAQSIPHLLEGKDLIATAQTGTGKTASFALPMLQKLSLQPSAGKRHIRSLILAPTRELALQIAENIALYGKYLNLRHLVIFGGISQHRQTQELQRGVDIVIATPGRLIDLINQGYVKLQQVEMLVLDEADRMFDMGFIPDLKRVFALVPSNRQTILFSATFPKEVKILAETYLRNPVRTSVGETSAPVSKINQLMYYVDKLNKPALLQLILNQQDVESTLVFTRTKRGADKLMKDMSRSGLRVGVIHGNKSQNDRNRTLDNFKQKKTSVLIATDVASRGIDIDHISHVINYDLPETGETYVHRIGRTGRAGAHGTAVSLCSGDELNLMRDVKNHVKTPITVLDSPFGALLPTSQNSSRPKQSNKPGMRNRKSRFQYR